MKHFLALLVMGAFVVSCGTSTTQEKEAQTESNQFTGLAQKAKTLFGSLPDVAENPENVVTKEKVALGKKLYFDVRLSKDNKISCNSCHNLETSGVDNLPVSPGNDQGTFGGRNSPTVLNAAFQMAQFWDGRAKDVEEQAAGPILNPVEMAIPTKEFLEARLKADDDYKQEFSVAFPSEKKPITFVNVQKAIAAFERKLVTPSSFDSFLAGDNNALTDEQKAGLDTFIKVGCIACHNGKLLGGTSYQKFGVFGNYWKLTKSNPIDNGRFDVTKNEADRYKFKVPTLRNVANTFPYFHDGSVKDLKNAVKIMGKLQLNKELSDEQVNSIISFLKSLSGEVPKELKQ